MNIKTFMGFLKKDPRYVGEYNKERQWIRVWSTDVIVPILIEQTSWVGYMNPLELTYPEWETDSPLPGFEKRALTIAAIEIVKSKMGWAQWLQIIGRELRQIELSTNLLKIRALVVEMLSIYPSVDTGVWYTLADLVGKSKELYERERIIILDSTKEKEFSE